MNTYIVSLESMNRSLVVVRILNMACKIILLCFLFTNIAVYIQPATNSPNMLEDSIDTNIPRSTQLPAQVPEVNRDFWTCNLDTGVHYEIAATLLTSGEYCHIYMQDSLIPQIGAVQAQSRCESYRDEFDTLIYPTVVELTGDPDGIIGDIDGDPCIIILISDNLSSYYSQYNEIVHTWSNECEMVYIYYNDFRILDTITHEFCHLIWFNYEFDEVHFILEGLAEYATLLCGYLESSNNESLRTSYFLENSNDPLIYFDVAARDYGNSYLFTFYLAERFGVQFLTDLVQHEDDGAYGIETALTDAGYNITFNQLYLDWITALTINELGFEDDKYGFHGLDVQIEDVTLVDALPFEIESMDVWCYASNIFELIEPADGLTIDTGDPSTGKIGLSIAYHDTEGWHVSQTISSDPIKHNITGIGLDSAYVIVTYFYASTPAGGIDFGVGIAEDIDLSISTYIAPTSPTTSNTADSNLINMQLILIGGGAIGLSVVLLFLYSKKQNH